MNDPRPQAKLLYAGTAALSNAELLSLIIGSGSRGKTSTALAGDILAYTEDNIGSLGCADVRELSAVYGVGESKASAIVAAIELGKRVQKEEISKARQPAHDAGYIADILIPELMYEKREHFIMFCLNTRLQIESKHVISIGNLNTAPIHPREVFAPAIKRRAAAIVVAHNHPSGDVTPSPEDIQATKRLAEAGELLGIKLLDHVIIAGGSYMSMRNEGLI